MDFKEYLSRGITFIQEGKIGPALDNLEAALKLQPNNADVQQMIAMLKMQAEYKAQGEQALENEIVHRANVIGINAEDADKAIAELTQTLRSNPDDISAKSALAQVYYLRGLTFQSTGEYTKAVEDYSEAIKYEPEYFFAFNKRGAVNLKMGNYDQAIKDYEKAFQMHPDDMQCKQNIANAYMRWGIEYDKKGDYGNAARYFEKSLDLDQGNNTTRELLDMAKTHL